MKKNILFFTLSFSVLTGADKSDQVSFSFKDNKIGTYDSSILKKSQTLKRLFEDTELSHESIPLKKFDKESFDSFYDLMKLKPLEMARSIKTKDNLETKQLLEISDFLDVPQIMTALSQGLLTPILSPSGINRFLLSTPEQFSSQFNNTIAQMLAVELQNNSAVQKSLLKAALSVAAFELSDDKWPRISNIALSSKNHLAIAYVDGLIEILNLQDKKIKRRLTASDTTYALNFSPDGNELAAACSDQNIYFWDVSTGQLSKKVSSSIRYGRNFLSRTIIFSPDNTYLLWTQQDTSVKIIDSHTGIVVKNLMFPGPFVTAIDCSSNGYLAAAILGKIELIKLADFTTVKTIPIDNKHEISTINFSKDNRRIAIGFTNREIQVYSLALTEGNIVTKLISSVGHEMKYAGAMYIQSLDFSSKNRWLASHEYSGSSDIWDLSTRTVLKNTRPSNGHGAALFSPDENFFVASSEKLLKIWDLDLLKHRLPLGTLMLLYLFDDKAKQYLLQFDKKTIENSIKSQLEQIDDQKDREIISVYLMSELKELMPQSLIQKIFKK